MFCPNCNTQLPDDIRFCTNCGTKQEPQEAAPEVQQDDDLTVCLDSQSHRKPDYQQDFQPEFQQTYQPEYQQTYQQNYQQTQYQAQPQQPSQKVHQQLLSKRQFLSKKIDPAASTCSTAVVFIMFLSLLLIVVSAISPIVQPFYNIPAVDVALEMVDADTDELMVELEQTVELLENAFDQHAETMSKDERKAAKQVLSSLKNLDKTPSVLNFYDFLVVTIEEGEDFIDSSDLAEMEQLQPLMVAVMAIVAIAFLLPLLFAFLGGLNKSTALIVVAMIFTALSQLVFSGILLLALSLVVYIIQIVLCSKVQKAYNNYLTGNAV